MKNLSTTMEVQAIRRALGHIKEAIGILDDLSDRTVGSRSGTYDYYAAELVTMLSKDQGSAGLVAFYDMVKRRRDAEVSR